MRLTTRVLTRQRRSDEQLDRMTGRKVTITVDGRDQYQLDGDTVGECGTMTAEVRPGALLLRVPRDSALVRPPQTDPPVEAALALTNGEHGPQAAPGV